MKHSYEGIGHMSVTLPAADCVVGQVCTLNYSGEVVSCNSGDEFIGVVESVNGEQAAVQIEGFVRVPYDGILPGCGYMGLVGNGKGMTTNSGESRKYLVVEVDGSANELVIKL